MKRSVLPIWASAAGALALAWSQPAHAQSEVVFRVSCMDDTAIRLCDPIVNPNTMDDTKNWGLYKISNGNLVTSPPQDYAIDLGTTAENIPTPPLPNSGAPAGTAYGTRFHYNPNPSPNGSASTVTTGMAFTGAGFFPVNDQAFRLNYGDPALGKSVVGTDNSFTRGLEFSFNKIQGGQPISLSGPCYLCNQSFTADGPGRLFGTGVFQGTRNPDGSVLNGKYSYYSAPGAITFSGGSKGLIAFDGSVTIKSGIVTATEGNIKISSDAQVGVPTPLPILGGGIALGWSRRLRRRLRMAAESR